MYDKWPRLLANIATIDQNNVGNRSLDISCAYMQQLKHSQSIANVLFQSTFRQAFERLHYCHR